MSNSYIALRDLAVLELVVLRKKTVESYRLFKEESDLNFIKAIDDELARKRNDKQI